MATTPLTTALGAAGTGLVFVMLSAQLPAVWHIIRVSKDTSGLSVLPTLGQALNFIAWTMYGLQQGDPNVINVNVGGCAFAACYFVFFIAYSRGQQRSQLLRLLAAAGALTAAIEAGLVLGVADKALRITLMGGLAVGFNVAMFAAPLAALRKALGAMDPNALPILLLLANVLVSSTWLLYGLLVGNWFIAGPNVAGTALNVLNLGTAGYIHLRVARDPSLTKRLALARASGGDGDDDSDAEERGTSALLGGDGLTRLDAGGLDVDSQGADEHA